MKIKKGKDRMKRKGKLLRRKMLLRGMNKLIKKIKIDLCCYLVFKLS